MERYYFIIDGIGVTVQDVSFEAARSQAEITIQEVKNLSEEI